MRTISHQHQQQEHLIPSRNHPPTHVAYVTAAEASDNNNFVSQATPNYLLSQEQRQAKKDLKARLKLASRKRKFQVRHQQALRRNDFVCAEQALQDLQELLNQEEDDHVDATDNHQRRQQVCPVEQASRRLVESIYHELQRILNKSSNNSNKEDDDSHKYGDSDSKLTRKQHNARYKNTQKREELTAEARRLLRCMTKGTQQLYMFDNPQALRGYVRQKFVERAMLVVTSLNKLRQQQQQQPSLSSTPREKILNKRLMSVRKVVSIGCGPGCDGVGAAAWIMATTTGATASPKTTRETSDHEGDDDGSATQKESSTSSHVTPLEQVVFLDWAMPQWSQIVQPVAQLLQSKQLVQRPCEMAKCNVILKNDPIDLCTDDNKNYNNNNNYQRQAVEHCATADLIITSYVLSETRGQWHDFYHQVVVNGGSSSHAATQPQRQPPPKGRLFLLTDPTAWQLHEWLHRYQDSLETWCWLDSSMNDFGLQSLEGRVGPAVLLAMTKTTSFVADTETTATNHGGITITPFQGPCDTTDTTKDKSSSQGQRTMVQKSVTLPTSCDSRLKSRRCSI